MYIAPVRINLVNSFNEPNRNQTSFKEAPAVVVAESALNIVTRENFSREAALYKAAWGDTVKYAQDVANKALERDDLKVVNCCLGYVVKKIPQLKKPEKQEAALFAFKDIFNKVAEKGKINEILSQLNALLDNTLFASRGMDDLFEKAGMWQVLEQLINKATANNIDKLFTEKIASKLNPEDFNINAVKITDLISKGYRNENNLEKAEMYFDKLLPLINKNGDINEIISSNGKELVGKLIEANDYIKAQKIAESLLPIIDNEGYGANNWCVIRTVSNLIKKQIETDNIQPNTQKMIKAVDIKWDRLESQRTGGSFSNDRHDLQEFIKDQMKQIREMLLEKAKNYTLA